MSDDGLFDLPAAEDRPDARRDSSGSLAGNAHSSAPLAVRMRPRTLDELVGQQHLLTPGSPLRQVIDGDQPLTILLWGPPGTGKTTIAAILSQQTDRRFVEVSAVSAGVKEVRAAIDAARALRSALHGFVDLENHGGFGLPVDVDRSFERLVSALERDLQTWV